MRAPITWPRTPRPVWRCGCTTIMRSSTGTGLCPADGTQLRAGVSAVAGLPSRSAGVSGEFRGLPGHCGQARAEGHADPVRLLLRRVASLESRHIWVANPGPDRMAPRWWPESDAYATAVVSAHAGDKRIALWDVMNEPTSTHLAATPEGKASIDAFVAHSLRWSRSSTPRNPSRWVSPPGTTAT